MLAQERGLLEHERGLCEALGSNLRDAEVRASRLEEFRVELATERATREALEAKLAEAEASTLAAKFLHDDLKRRQAEQRIEALLFKRVIVHTRSGHSIEGVLAGSYADSVVVRHARYLLAENGTEQLDGDQIIPSGNVEWIQELTDAGASYTER